jgi:hypothetical protein
VTWTISLAIGAVAGAINAVLTGNLHLLPAAIRAETSRRIDAVQIGLIGNMTVAAAATMACAFALGSLGCEMVPTNDVRRALAAGAALLIGFAVARWCTSETDKRLLRSAVCKASAAPAAHPEAVSALETAPPMVIYRAADELMPRRTGHR